MTRKGVLQMKKMLKIRQFSILFFLFFMVGGCGEFREEPKDSSYKSSLDEPFYYTENFEDSPFTSLKARLDDQSYVLIRDTQKMCFTVIDQRDYSDNGWNDALIKKITGCGGSASVDTFYFAAYLGDGHFELSDRFGNSYGDPVIETWRGRSSVIVTSHNEGINTYPPEEVRERFILDSGQALRVEKSERKEIEAIVEMRSDEFDIQKFDETVEIYFDLNGDGTEDRISGRLWNRWGRILWTVNLSTRELPESNIGCKRLGILETQTMGFHDLVCDHDTIFRWNGEKYASASE